MEKGISYPPGEDKWFDVAHHPERTCPEHSRGSRRKDFHQRVASYQAWDNIVRVNSNKDYKSPWQIIRELNPKMGIELVRLPPLMLDWLGPDYITKEELSLRRYDLPCYPCFCCERN
jgi:hypothetical protein